MKFTSTSALFVVCECSSNSPLPVRLAVLVTSEIDNSSVSTKLPKLLLSSNDVPGFVTIDNVNAPSLNSGKKLLPKVEKIIIAITNIPIVGNTISFLCFIDQINDFS